MERTFLETIQSLGLDVQLGIILLLLALDGLAALSRRFAAWSAEHPRRVRRRRAAARASAADATPGWPPSLSASGGTAA